MNAYIYGIELIALGGIGALLASERLKGRMLAIFTGLGMLFVLSPALRVLLGVKTLTLTVGWPLPIGPVHLVIDRLAAFFLVVIVGLSFLGTLYAVGYLQTYVNQGRSLGSHLFFLSLLIDSMLLVVVVQNALAFLLVWEIMSLASFFLVVFEHEKAEVYQAGLNYLIAMHIGVIFLISGFVLLANQAGSFDFQSFPAVFASPALRPNLVFLLFFVGFGVKAGFVPLHAWLPRAHPAAPSHISGLMSGIMIKTGIYGILRILLLLKTPTAEIAYLVFGVSLISGIIGVAYALAQHDIKRLLAYHSVENIGIIGIGIGLGLLGVVHHQPVLALLGFAGGILHVCNHALFKSLLFYAVGGVYQQTHLVNLEKLGGLIKPMPATAFCFLFGSLAISGLPPLNGFVSEFLIYWGMLRGLHSSHLFFSVVLVLAIAGLALIGAMALLCFTKAFSVIFLGSPRSAYHQPPQEVAGTMRAAMFLQCVGIGLIGLFPQYAFRVISKVALDFLGPELTPPNVTPILQTLTSVSGGLFLFLGIAVAIGLIRARLLRDKRVTAYKTWDCGYQAGNARMQYTASSYAAPFVELIAPLLHRRVQRQLPEGLFPQHAHFESHVADIVETKVITPVINGLARFFNAFAWIQSGNTQQYILYGLLFLLAVIFWIMLV